MEKLFLVWAKYMDAFGVFCFPHSSILLPAQLVRL